MKNKSFSKWRLSTGLGVLLLLIGFGVSQTGTAKPGPKVDLYYSSS